MVDAGQPGDRGGDGRTGSPADDRVAEATEHMQRAAIEFIAAARVLLDVAEEAVREPSGVLALASDTIGALLGAVGSVATARSPGGGGGAAGGHGDRPQPTVEHIRVT